jgi:hypothetical protein
MGVSEIQPAVTNCYRSEMIETLLPQMLLNAPVHVDGGIVCAEIFPGSCR